jgi:hypothetical protein
VGDDGARQLSPLFDRSVLRWDAKAGVYQLHLDEGYRQILEELMLQFLALLDDPGAPVLHRLFPPAYSDPSDVESQDDYRRLMMDDLVELRRADCRMVMATASQKALTEDQLLAWSRSINGLRLTLGTYLDVHDDDEVRPPESAEESAYHLLGWLLEEAVEAMSKRI